MIEEGEESYKPLKTKGEKPLTNWQWIESLRCKNAHRGRLWKMMGKEQFVREMWEHFAKSGSKKGFESRLKKKGKQEHGVAVGIAS